MKKISNIITFLVLMILSLTFNNVKATYIDKILNGNWIPNEYVKKVKGTYHRYQTMSLLTRKSDNEYIYCIQPGILIDGSATYNGYEEDYVNISQLTQAQWERISKLSYYGYGYVDDTQNHTNIKWYVITQFMIWHSVPSLYDDIYFTDTLNGNRITKYETEMQEMEELINQHETKPNFNIASLNMNIGQTITLTDTNNVLNHFNIINDNNIISTNKMGNKLVINARNIGNSTIVLKKDLNRLKRNRIIYIHPTSQMVLFAGDLDPVITTLNVNIIGGKVTINKYDLDTQNQLAQGQATLEGAIYGIYEENGTKVGTITTDKNGNATSNYLTKLGKYYLQEEHASTGYELDNTKYYFKLTTDNLNPVVKVYEKIIKTNIKITKLDMETNTCNDLLKKAVYEILDENNNVIDTVTIGAGCMAISKDLIYGNYKVKEKTPPPAYHLDSKIYEVTINNSNQKLVVSKEKIIKGKIKINKRDAETNSCLPQGQATLEGAKFVIKDINNNIVDTLIIDNNCTATSKLLPYGKYKIAEIKASKGYYLNNEIETQDITQDKTYNIIYKNKVIKNWLNILKQYDYVDGNSTFLNAEANIKFAIFYPDGTKYGEITTDNNGHAAIFLPYGVWKFQQVNSTTGYEKIYDFYITVDENSKLTHYYNILNNALSAYLKVLKIDSETNKIIEIANTTFKILDLDTNNFVSQYVGGKVYDTFKTDEHGVMVTYLKLKSGNYKLIETKNPNGYLLDEDGLNFTIGDNTHYSYTNYGAFVTIKYPNTSIKGQIEIQKDGEEFVITNNTYHYDKTHLKNVKFNLYANSDIKSLDGNYLYYEKDDLVTTLTTDDMGYAISDLLPLGEYYLVEIKTNDNYILNNKPFYFKLKEKDNLTPLVLVNYNNLNKLKKGQIEILKIDSDTKKAIPNVKIELYTSNNELIYTGLTNQEGKIVIKNLPLGKYYIKEVSTLNGYILNNEKQYIEIKNNDETFKLTITNEKAKAIVHIHKVNENNEPLENVEIGIYDLNDNLIGKYQTDQNGDIKVELPYGKYYCQEIRALKNYVINDEKMAFEISTNQEEVSLKLINQLIKVNVPNTSIKDLKLLNVLVFLPIILGIGFIIYAKKKEKNNYYLIIGCFLISFSLLILSIKHLDNNYINKNNDIQVIKYLSKASNTSNNLNTDIKPEKTKINSKKSKYIGILEIPCISFKRGFVAKNSPNNNVNKNIQILKESDLPDVNNGIVIFAGHSGTGKLAFFKNLSKLKKDDDIFIYYNHKKYHYKIIDYYLEDKTGKITIKNNNKYSLIVLTTCSQTKGKQLTYIGKMIEIIK